MKNSQKQKLIKEYKKNEQLYSEFALLVKNLLEGFLRSKNFKYQIFSRSKDIKKLSEKIERKLHNGKEYKTLDEIEDLAGVRIVFYLEEDKKNFLEQFLGEFANCIVDEEEKYTQGGYKGQHFIFRLNKERVEMVEYRAYADLKCEIQVSTILFHAWSEVEHDIIYKTSGDKDLLQSLGLDEIKLSFEKVMTEHLQAATYQLDYLNKQNSSLTKAGEVFGSDFLSDIASLKNNDSIYETLTIIENYFHKKPDETMAIINLVIGARPLKPSILYKYSDRKIYGKAHKDLVIKCLEILEHIRYIKPDETLQLLSILSLNVNQEISSKALDVLKKMASYDYNYIKSVQSYDIQRMVLDFVKAWSLQAQLQYIDFMKTVLREILSSAVEGTTTGINDEAQFTLTMHTGVVQPTDFLKEMRHEAIDLIYGLLKSTEDGKLKKELIGIFDEAHRAPSSVQYGEDVVKMNIDDMKYIVGIYRNIIYGYSGDTIICPLGIAAAIETQLYWTNRNEQIRVEESEELHRDILNDRHYHLYRLLVGDSVTYQEQEDWETAEKKRIEEIDGLIDTINPANLGEWSEEINNIADQDAFIDEWSVSPLKSFLRKLSEIKPQIADDLLGNAFNENRPIKKYAGSFLDGFRAGSHLEYWDKYVKIIINNRESSLTSAIVFSLNLPDSSDLQKLIRDDDIDLLENISKRDIQFSYLKDVDDRTLSHSLFEMSARNFKRDPKRLESIIRREIKGHPKYLGMYFTELLMFSHRKWMSVTELQPKTVKFLEEEMVKLVAVDWHTQDLLVEIGEKYGLSTVMDIFIKRIHKYEKLSGKRGKAIADTTRYEAIPYHFNQKLSEFIAGNSDYIKIAGGWVSNMTTSWSIYNWDISHFLQRIGKGFHEVVSTLIQEGDDDSLLKAARALHSLDGANIDLCLKIVQQTDNEEILSQVESDIFTTGVVSGEYGLAEAYEKKAKTLEQYAGDSSERIQKFVTRITKGLLESSKRARQSTDEEKQLRKIGFEG